jgi:hypothetical protein
MTIAKAKTGSARSPKQPNGGRRSFLRRTGAAVSAVLASAIAGAAKSAPDTDASLKGEVAALANRIGCLEDANAIRALQQKYESSLDKGMYEDVVRAFARDAEVVFNGGVFVGRDKGVRRLFCENFSQGFTGKRIEPAPGFEPDPAQIQEVVEVAPDRASARATFPYSMQVGTPLVSDWSLLDMARLQGQGILQWWEGGVQEVAYVKEGAEWKIRRLEYRVLSRANYRPGRSYAKPISIPQFSEVYPANAAGPDRIVVNT